MNALQKRTKIVCTVGPATGKPAVIGALMDAGMNVARLNFSHGTYREHSAMMKAIRKEADKRDMPVAILQDLQGPKIRIGAIQKKGILIVAGKTVVFSTRPKPPKGTIPVTYLQLHADVQPGHRLLISDGLMDLVVKKVVGREVTCEVGNGGLMLPHAGMNLPDTKVSASAMSDKDRQDVAFGVKHDVDWIALSFVRSAKDIYDLRYLIKQQEKAQGKKPHPVAPIRIIAKIEKTEAVEVIEEILDAADGIMVARGDLGVEAAAEDVPLIQKMLIERALASAKPVIVATQMLDSMIRNPRPTRAEVSDVANAVIDHTDAVMLSGETATGKYPVETVKTMSRIVGKAETSKYDDIEVMGSKKYATEEEAVSSMASILARSTDATCILVASLSGAAARIVSRYRPELPVFASTIHHRVYRQLACSWGVVPFILPNCQSIEELIERSIAILKKKKYLKNGDRMIVIAGEPVGVSGHINFVELRAVGE